jgi:nitrate/nitrite-specific signal transduction histidine kinase
MKTTAPDVRLMMPARPEGVAVVRQALAGMVEVDMMSDENGLTIRVRDYGAGIHPHSNPSRDVPALGLGLPLIAALSDAFELSGSAGQGTEVRMTFHYARDGDPAEENRVPGSVGEDGRWDADASRETPTP